MTTSIVSVNSTTSKVQVGGVDSFSFDNLGNMALVGKLTQSVQSMVRVSAQNGYGSTNTKIRRFTNILTSQGTDITYADSATLGGSFTVNTNGVYAIAYQDQGSAAMAIGLSLNTTAPTVSIASIADAERLGVVSLGSTLAGSYSATMYLTAGSVIRPHTDGSAGIGTLQSFIITRVA
jgi:hypothetical protein